MKMVKGIYVLLTMFLLIGCATVMNPYKMDNRMHKIELGMTKQKVISGQSENPVGMLNLPC